MNKTSFFILSSALVFSLPSVAQISKDRSAIHSEVDNISPSSAHDSNYQDPCLDNMWQPIRQATESNYYLEYTEPSNTDYDSLIEKLLAYRIMRYDSTGKCTNVTKLMRTDPQVSLYINAHPNISSHYDDVHHNDFNVSVNGNHDGQVGVLYDDSNHYRLTGHVRMNSLAYMTRDRPQSGFGDHQGFYDADTTIMFTNKATLDKSPNKTITHEFISKNAWINQTADISGMKVSLDEDNVIKFNIGGQRIDAKNNSIKFGPKTYYNIGGYHHNTWSHYSDTFDGMLGWNSQGLRTITNPHLNYKDGSGNAFILVGAVSDKTTVNTKMTFKLNDNGAIQTLVDYIGSNG